MDDHDNVGDYRMKVHLFGAKSSPGVATFGLRRAAKDCSGISESAYRFLHDDFYVDDGVVTLPTKEAAIKLIREATQICSKANICLYKFLSNDKEILASVPESERGESTKGIDLFNENLPTERTLDLDRNGHLLLQLTRNSKGGSNQKSYALDNRAGIRPNGTCLTCHSKRQAPLARSHHIRPTMGSVN